MEELDKKSQKGLDRFAADGDLGEVEKMLDQKIDALIADQTDPVTTKKFILSRGTKILIIILGLGMLSILSYFIINTYILFILILGLEFFQFLHLSFSYY